MATPPSRRATRSERTGCRRVRRAAGAAGVGGVGRAVPLPAHTDGPAGHSTNCADPASQCSSMTSMCTMETGLKTCLKRTQTSCSSAATAAVRGAPCWAAAGRGAGRGRPVADCMRRLQGSLLAARVPLHARRLLPRHWETGGGWPGRGRGRHNQPAAARPLGCALAPAAASSHTVFERFSYSRTEAQPAWKRACRPGA